MKKRKSNDAQTNEFDFQTSSEINALEQSAAAGRFLELWNVDTNNNYGLPRFTFSTPTHTVSLSHDDKVALEKFLIVQDSDFIFSMLYVLGAILPAKPLPPNTRAAGWVDLSDVMEKIGWNPRRFSIAEREKKRQKIYQYLLFAQEATVNGARSKQTYVDPITGQEVNTFIDSPIWKINREEKDVVEENGQLILADVVSSEFIAPRRVEIVITLEWMSLLQGALAQYLPAAQCLTPIPPNQVSGDWARNVGLCLARLWRSHPRETLAGKTTVSRRDLLTHYAPKTRTVDELLKSPNPHRAVQYWSDALRHLVKVGLVEDSNEATRTVEEVLDSYQGYNWGEIWLDEQILLFPGPLLLEQIKERAEKQPEKPALSTKSRRKKKAE